MRKLWAVVMAGVVLGTASMGLATEGGGGVYPNGAEGFMTGAVPPPGHYLINYMLYYSADDFMGADGKPMKQAPGSDVVEPFDLTVYAEVLRLINVTKTHIFGASWAQHVFIPIMRVDVDPPAPGVPADDTIGLGDIIVDPCILAWHTPNFHVAAGLDIYVPVGKYDRNDVANIGRNYWTFEPVVAATYRNRQGIEASAKFMYDFNMENTDTDYDSGDEFHADFVLAKYFGPLGVGLGGFYYKQVTDDEGMITPAAGADPIDVALLDGFKGKQWAWGPQISYQVKNMNFALKYQREEDTENKPEGDRIWFKFVTNF